MIKAVIFDWAGTTIDYGCFAPIKGFIDGFKSIGKEITNEVARKPMGLLKLEHARAIARMLPDEISEEDIQKAYSVFESTLFENIKNHCNVKEYVIETVKALRDRGIKIGTTTGYTRAMMNEVMKLSAKNGYEPDFCVASDEVKSGRPKPFMIWANLSHFEIDNPRFAVKVGDTVADIKEGQSANCWTVGIIMGSSVLGLTQEEVSNLSSEELEIKKQDVRKIYYQAGADYIINDMSELIGVIDDINKKLAQAGSHKLLTPGPLTTKSNVKNAMLTDHCTWDDEYKEITTGVINDINAISANDNYATVLLQGSGSYAVEAMINCFSGNKKALFLVNGEYGKRMLTIAENSNLNFVSLSFDMAKPIDVNKVEQKLNEDNEIETVVFVHCETTTGVLNPLEQIVKLAKDLGKTVLVDAMSSFAAYEIDMAGLDIDALATSSNKCLEGLPGLSFVIAKKTLLEESKGVSKSHSLDLYDQYKGLYDGGGKFRFTSPTNILLALRQAIDEYNKEGGLSARKARYTENHSVLVSELGRLGFKPIVKPEHQSYIITTFELGNINFKKMYNALKSKGFIIYPGKLTDIETFRLGNIGDVYPSDMYELSKVLEEFLKGE